MMTSVKLSIALVGAATLFSCKTTPQGSQVQSSNSGLSTDYPVTITQLAAQDAQSTARPGIAFINVTGTYQRSLLGISSTANIALDAMTFVNAPASAATGNVDCVANMCNADPYLVNGQVMLRLTSYYSPNNPGHESSFPDGLPDIVMGTTDDNNVITLASNVTATAVYTKVSPLNFDGGPDTMALTFAIDAGN